MFDPASVKAFERRRMERDGKVLVYEDEHVEVYRAGTAFVDLHLKGLGPIAPVLRMTVAAAAAVGAGLQAAASGEV